MSGDDPVRERLHAERTRLVRLIRARSGDIDELRDEDDEEASEEHERGDAARTIVEGQQQHAVLEELEDELAEIDAALARVQAGTYGIDEVTGEPIDPARLEALPTARTNVDTESS